MAYITYLLPGGVRVLEAGEVPTLEECRCVLGDTLNDSDIASMVQEHPEVSRVCIHRCPSSVTCDSLTSIAKRCQKLTHVELLECSFVDDAAVEVLVTWHTHTLTHISLEGSPKVTNKTLKALSVLPGLIYLNMSFCESVSDIGVELVPRTLNTLRCNGCRKLTDKLIAGCKGLPMGLTDLDLGSCERITDSGVAVLLARCRDMKRLCLHECPHVTKVPPLATLEELYLGGTSVTGDAVASLAVCPKLRVLNVWGCSSMTDTSLSTLSNTLEELTVSFCDRISDATLQCLGSTLKVLNCSGCPLVTDVGVISLGQSLRSLRLDACRQITDVSLTHLASQCPQLRELHCRGCELLTDKGLTGLKQCPVLAAVTFAGCPLVSRGAVKGLVGVKDCGGSDDEDE